MRINLILLVLLMSSSSTASAGELRRCVGPDGSVTWTDEPCPAEARQDKVVSPEAIERETFTRGPILRAAKGNVPEGQLACMDGYVVRSVGGTFVNLLDTDPSKSKMPCRVAAEDSRGN